MKWYSALALYLLFWTFTLFLVLPFGIRTSDELGKAKVPGQAASAPHHPQMGRKLAWTTLISAIFFGLFWLNWEMGWISREAFLSLFFDPAAHVRPPAGS
jgi:predicted secreted protein